MVINKNPIIVTVKIEDPTALRTERWEPFTVLRDEIYPVRLTHSMDNAK